MVSVLLSASVERCFVSRMRDFFERPPFSQQFFQTGPSSLPGPYAGNRGGSQEQVFTPFKLFSHHDFCYQLHNYLPCVYSFLKSVTPSPLSYFSLSQASSLFPLNINKMQVSLSGPSDGLSFTIETHNTSGRQRDSAHSQHVSISLSCNASIHFKQSAYKFHPLL